MKFLCRFVLPVQVFCVQGITVCPLCLMDLTDLICVAKSCTPGISDMKVNFVPGIAFLKTTTIIII